MRVPTEPSARFWAKVDRRDDDECWPWTGHLDRDGYGTFRTGGRGSLTARAHRYSWEKANRRPIPAGLVIDHLCRNRACVNPHHLDTATNRVNIMRGMGRAALNARKTHCDHGHRLTPENTYLSPKSFRYCRQCFREEYPSRLAGKARS